MTEEPKKTKRGTTEAETNRRGKTAAVIVTMELMIEKVLNTTATLFMLPHQVDPCCLSVAHSYSGM